GIVVVHGLRGKVTLMEPDALPAAHIDRREDLQLSALWRPGSVGQRVPLVDGTPAPSMRTASCSDRATPLNDASITWWPFLPVIERICSVSPAAIANARQNSSASCGSNVPIHSATGSTS